MHSITIPDTPEAVAFCGMSAGTYVAENNNAAELMLMHQALRPLLRPFDTLNPKYNLASNRLLVVGTLGFGDAIMLTPVLRRLKELYPLFSIELACWENTRQVFLNLPYVDGFIDYPVKREVLEDFCKVFYVEHSVEFNEKAKTQHMTDRFAEHLGISLGENKKPDFKLSGDEIAWAFKSFPPTANKKRLALQVQAGVRCRSYPISLLTGEHITKDKKRQQSVLADLIDDGWEIALMGAPGEFRLDSAPKGMIDMSRHGLTFRQSAAYLLTCSAFLGPDSSLLHVAGSLDIPAVGLFGPFPHHIRTCYYKSVFALHGSGVCPMAPCFHTHHTGLPLFPKDGPCNKSGVCDELTSISPDRIMAKVKQVALESVTTPV